MRLLVGNCSIIKNIVLLIIGLFWLSCRNERPVVYYKTAEFREQLERFSNDSALMCYFYSKIDTFQGYWVIKVSKEEAVRNGIPPLVFDRMEESRRLANHMLDSIKQTNPKMKMGYHFPTEILKYKESKGL